MMRIKLCGSLRDLRFNVKRGSSQYRGHSAMIICETLLRICLKLHLQRKTIIHKLVHTHCIHATNVHLIAYV